MKRSRIFACVFILSILLAALLPAGGFASAAPGVKVDYFSCTIILDGDGTATVREEFSLTVASKVDKLTWSIPHPLAEEPDFSFRQGNLKLKPVYEGAVAGGRTDYYQLVSQGNQNVLTFYTDKEDAQIDYRLTYRCKAEPVMYKDAAQMSLALMGRQAYAIEAFDFFVQLPAGGQPQKDAQELMAWASRSGLDVEITDGRALKVSGKNLDAQTAVSVRMLMAAGYFEPAYERGDIEGAQRVIDEETRLARYRRAVDFFSGAQPLIGALSIALAVGLSIVIRKRPKRFVPQAQAAGPDALPTEVTCAQMVYLNHFYRRFGTGSLYRRALQGTLVQLYALGLLTVDMDADGRARFGYVMRTDVETTDDENMLLVFLFDDVASGGDTFTMRDVRRFTARAPGVVGNALGYWVYMICQELIAGEFVEPYPKKRLFHPGLIVAPLFALAALGLLSLQQWESFGAMLVGAFIVSIMSRDRLHRLGQRGEDVLAKTRALKAYLKNLRFEDPLSLPGIIWWTDALPYLAATGQLEKIKPQLPQLYPQMWQDVFIQENPHFLRLLDISGEGEIMDSGVSRALKKLAGRLSRYYAHGPGSKN
ncbi:MAG: DUF2207 family protein [Christensenellales bacterium]|jgi:hypothetical protein